MHSLMLVAGFFMDLSMNDFFFYFFFYLDVYLLLFYDWGECVLSVLGTTKLTFLVQLY